jgi:hypothetical protein
VGLGLFGRILADTLCHSRCIFKRIDREKIRRFRDLKGLSQAGISVGQAVTVQEETEQWIFAIFGQ